MADFGMKFAAADSAVQVDGEYANYAEIDRGTFTPTSRHSSDVCSKYDYYTYDLTFSAFSEPPVAAIHSASLIGVLRYLRDSNGNYTGIRFQCEKGGSFDYLLYLPSHFLSPSWDWGMAVWDGVGEVMFHSDLRYMKVVDYRELDGTHNGSFSHASTSKPYYLPGGIAGQGNPGDDLLGLERYGVRNVDGSTGELSAVPHYNLLYAISCLITSSRHPPKQYVVVVKE